MTKAQIKAKIRKFKYYDSRLNENRKEIEKIGADDAKAQRRFLVETELAMKMFQVFQLTTFADNYDIIQNPKQRMTKLEARRFVTSENTANEKFVKHGGYTFMYIPESELVILEKVYNELLVK